MTVATIDMGRKDGGSCCAPFAQSWDPVLYNVACAEVYFRTKWRIRLSSRLATIDMGQKLGGGGCVLFSGDSWVPIEHKVTWAETYLHTKCHLSPPSRLATTDICRKLGGLSPFKEGEAVSPSTTKSPG